MVGQTAVKRERQVHVLIAEIVVIGYYIFRVELMLSSTLCKELIVNDGYMLVDTTIVLIEDLVKVHLTLLAPADEVGEAAVLEPHLILLFFHDILEGELSADLTRARTCLNLIEGLQTIGLVGTDASLCIEQERLSIAGHHEVLLRRGATHDIGHIVARIVTFAN